MTALWLVSLVLTWAILLLLAFLLLGTLRAQGLLAWREQLEATMTSRISRSGLAPGRQAPNFTRIVSRPYHLGYILARAQRQPARHDKPVIAAPSHFEQDGSVLSSSAAP